MSDRHKNSSADEVRGLQTHLPWWRSGAGVLGLIVYLGKWSWWWVISGGLQAQGDRLCKEQPCWFR
ncbi:unnamed protein product [Tetraodon nigroviridis]|uniref:(spotted green pufferfish) hypothetical protein n=1 Tax=Tetraodon nigroviridis TaxID=99883 RepID=Q4RUI8_TETNG|nr:unnamed protein product [Tetraodon nigroviridis]